MRMRRKKYLEQRLEECGDYIIMMQTDDKNFITALDNKTYLDFYELFGNDNPVHLEIGCGKGQFACEIAERNPDINYLAVEKVANVIVAAAENAKSRQIPNLKFLKGGAEYLPCYIPDNSIDRIYLNFSCPYPKNRYANHRLTHRNFLKIYRDIMTENAEIHQKTDNMKLFEFSLEQLSQNGFMLKNISLDLHNSGFEGNIVTEYEQRFTDLGQPIYRLEAYIPRLTENNE
ncbi:MAG: tRNA (guanosine(46)-N7)-methyltransferase TrmB [Clostridia bacterium]|nr:tRNA (guanosine(46)-N7)-methyltransferase TrmB [Clostridia bacterium]